MTKDLNIADVIARIERAPNVARLAALVDAALGGGALAINRVGARWEVAEDGFALYQADFATVRRRLASYVRDAHTYDEADEAAPAAAPAMVAQPVQQQQACAAPAAPKALTREELLSQIKAADRQYAEAVAEMQRKWTDAGKPSRLELWLADGPRAMGVELRVQLAELDRVAMENPPAQGFRVVKCWVDDADVFQTLTFPRVFVRAEDATGEIVSLLGGRDPELYSEAERAAGALLTMDEVGPAPEMVPQPVQQQQACAAPARLPWADKWTRISSRVYGDALLGVIAAATADVSRDPHPARGLPVVRVEGERHVFLGWAENEDAAAACGTAWECQFDVAVRVIGEDGPVAYALLGAGTDVDELRLFEPSITAFDGEGAEVDECDERACSWIVGSAHARWTFDGHNAACRFAELCETIGLVPRFEGDPASVKPAGAEPARVEGYRIVKRWRDAQGGSRDEAFPIVFTLAERAAAVVEALLGNGYQAFYGPDDRKRGATLDVEAVTVPAA